MRGRIAAGVGVVAVALLLLVFLRPRDPSTERGRTGSPTPAATTPSVPPPTPATAKPGGAKAPTDPGDSGPGDGDEPMQRWWEGHVTAVTVRVLRAEDREPIAGAKVEWSMEGEAPRIAVTGADGTARFDGFPAKPFRVEASAENRVRDWAEESQSDVGGRGTMEDGAFVLALQPGIAIRGVVLAAADRRPISGARVRSLPGGRVGGEVDHTDPDESLGAVETDSEGRFAAAPVPPGKIASLLVDHPGYREGDRSFIPPEAPAAARPLEFLLDAAASIQGVVLGPGGKVAAGSVVRAVPVTWDERRDEEDTRWIRYPEGNLPGDALGRDVGGRAVAGGDGRYSIGGLEPGAAHRVYALVEETSRSPLVEVTAPPAGGIASCDLRLVPLRRVFVRVEGPSGFPPSFARVLLVPAAGPWPEDEEDDPGEDGRYVFEGVLPGDYLVLVRPSGLLRIEVAVRVEEGGDAEVTVRPEVGAAIEGVLENELGAPIHGAAIYVERLAEDGNDPDAPDPTEEFRQYKTGDDGAFRAEGLQGGWYRMTFTSRDGVEAVLPKVRAPSKGLRPVVARAAIAVARIAVPVGVKPPEHLNAGMTTYFDGGGIRSGGGELSFDGTGLRFTGVRPGRNEFSLQPPGFARVTRSFDAAPGQTVDLGTIPLSLGVTFAGRVVDESEKPVWGAKVSTEWFGPEPRITSDQGRFRLEHLPEGEVRIDVEASGFPRTRVPVTVGATMGETVIRLARGGVVKGSVRREGEIRRPQTSLCFRPDGAGDHDFHPEAYVDSDGEYEVQLAAGKYAVTWYRRGAEGPAGAVEVAEGSEQTFDVVIPAK